jgi:hypothetical protein
VKQFHFSFSIPKSKVLHKKKVKNHPTLPEIELKPTNVFRNILFPLPG